MSTINCFSEEIPDEIAGYRHAQYQDLPSLERLMCPTTYEMFGDVEVKKVYEASCLSVVQYNEKHDIVSGICLYNYPNVPSVPPYDWLTWIRRIYGIPYVTERNTMFVHLLVWDERYSGRFLKDLLAALFDIIIHCQRVILVVPPRVTPANVFQREMTRVLAKGVENTDAVQFLYLGDQQRLRPKLKIRGVVEEDNDDLVPIINNETTRLKELYGDYYISEMIRYPDGYRQLIIGEESDVGSIAGMICLNSMINVDLLNEYFELTPYNGLRKPHEDDETLMTITEEPFRQTSPLRKLDLDQSTKSNVYSADNSQIMSVNDLPSALDYFNVYFQSKVRISASEEAIFRFSQGSASSAVATESETTQSQFTHAAPLRPPPTYRGEVNVFVLEIFAMRREGRRPHWSWDFLEAAFECFPNLEYCVVLLSTSQPCYQFLQHFTLVPFRYDKDFPAMLYVVHRAVFLGELKCRRAETQDRKTIQELLSTVPARREILTDFDLATHPAQLDLDCFVFECNSTILGLAVLCAEKQVDLVNSRYQVEDYVSTRDIPEERFVTLLHFILTPIFLVHYRFLLCEIARLSESTVVFYRLHRQNERVTRKQSLVSCISDMIPVGPRGQILYRFPNKLTNRGDRENDAKNNDPFCLFMTSPRLTMMPRESVNMKIVIVGASDCGVALAECLTLWSTHCYTNVTLISPHGLPFDNEVNRVGARLLPFRGTFCPEYRHRVAARTWINVVYGFVTAINRKKRYVTVMNQGNLEYDYLVLTCGLQYQRWLFREETSGARRGGITAERVPWNFLVINDDTEAFVCLKKIQKLTQDLKEEKAILLYGCNVDCYCALHGLVEFGGVNSSWITLIEPESNSHDDLRRNREVYETVTNAAVRSGVKVLYGWRLIDWVLAEKANGEEEKEVTIVYVDIEKNGEKRTLACDVLLNFYEKTINSSAFLAFCRAGLIFDGLLIIDQECRTNDPFIFAAGTMTTYSRKLYAESWKHKHFSSVEVGERLAEILRRMIDAYQRNEETFAQRRKENMYSTIPIFRAPVVTACVLPGDYYYLHVRKPGEEISYETIDRNRRGEVLVTGSCTSESGYFRIQLNPHDSVEAVTCVSKKVFQVQNMVALYGKHETMLNELKFRFRNSAISDFYAYFQEPWAALISHDRFEYLRVENRATLLTCAPGDALIDDCVRALNKSERREISEEDRRYIESRYAGSVYRQKLEDNLVNFLEFHEDDLPMYCTARKQRQMYKDIEESPLYYEQ